MIVFRARRVLRYQCPNGNTEQSYTEIAKVLKFYRLSKQAVTKGTHNFKLSFFSFLDSNICPHFQWKTICNPLYWKYLKLAGMAQGDCESQRSRYAAFLNKDARLPGF